MNKKANSMNLTVNQHALDSHTPEKGSHFDGPWSSVVELVAASSDWKEGFKPGIREVTVDPTGFYAGVAKLNEDSVLTAKFAPRRKGEEPVVAIRTTASGGKLPATRVMVVIYSHEALGAEATTKADWEIVSVQADAGVEQVMDPVTMARNFLGMEGGTQGEFSAEDFAKAIIHWAQHAVVG